MSSVTVLCEKAFILVHTSKRAQPPHHPGEDTGHRDLHVGSGRTWQIRGSPGRADLKGAEAERGQQGTDDAIVWVNARLEVAAVLSQQLRNKVHVS